MSTHGVIYASARNSAPILLPLRFGSGLADTVKGPRPCAVERSKMPSSPVQRCDVLGLGADLAMLG